MALTPGTRLGPYEILSALGAGGMGLGMTRRFPALRDRVVAMHVEVNDGSSSFRAPQTVEQMTRTVRSLLGLPDPSGRPGS